MFGSVHTAYSAMCIIIIMARLGEGYQGKAAVLFSVPVAMSAGVCWRWRSVDGNTDSTQSFMNYYDCLENARANGYQVEAKPQHNEVAPTRLTRSA
jgi:hypothetical protein